jgi:Outer membrane protein and related peptidoglycan-associated (lipo)proteins
LSMKFAYFLLLGSLLSTSALWAQTDPEKLSDQYFREGMEAYNFSHSKQAIELFQLAINSNPKNAKAHLMAGKSILLTIGKQKALHHFKQAFTLNPGIDEDILFLIGQAYHYNELFDSALLYYDLMNQSLSRSLRFSRVMKMTEVNWKIFECRNAKVFKANPVAVNITHLSENINSEWPDYAPTIAANESIMIYTSRRPEKNENPSLAEDLEFYEEILSSKNVNGQWQPAVGIDEINSSFHDASVSLSPDGKEMFVYGDENGGDIYETDLQPDGTWSRPKRLNGFINSPYFESSAAVTAGNDRLFFVSDRPEGYGGTDIYVATKNKRGEWADVQNLGPFINTERDEEDVFITASGRHLYFSSNGHAGMGDLDIYRSEYDSTKNQWSEPLNLGYPINSVESDIYFVLTGDERYAYFSSARADSKGDQDIYRVDLKDWKPVSRESLEAAAQAFIHQTAAANVFQVKEVNPSSTTPVANAPTEWKIQLKDEATGQPIEGDISLLSNQSETKMKKADDGSYQIVMDAAASEYQIKILSKGYESSTLSVKFDGNQSGSKLNQTIFLKREKTVAVASVEPGRSLASVFNLFYESNIVVPQHKEVLDLVVLKLKEDASCDVVIVGNTDNYGEEDYNIALSQRRAEDAKGYLVKSGIDPSRIKVMPLGESKPQGDNKTSAGRRINRRTDLILQQK